MDYTPSQLLYCRGKFFPSKAGFAHYLWGYLFILLLLSLLAVKAHSWTLSDLHPCKWLWENRVFSLTRANPVGVRIMIVPVIENPVNAPIYTRLTTEFSDALRSFASEVWIVTDLPDPALKKGFFTAMPRILADYKLRNHLSMDLLRQMIPDFECDYIVLFEVTMYDRYWIDEDLQHRVCVRAVFYDYETGDPKIEKFFSGGRGRRLEEGSFSEAERFAIKGLVNELEVPLRKSIAAREAELKSRYQDMGTFAKQVGQQELAIHKYDLELMKQQISDMQTRTTSAENELKRQNQQLEYWKKQAEQKQSELEKIKSTQKTVQPVRFNNSIFKPMQPVIQHRPLIPSIQSRTQPIQITVPPPVSSPPPSAPVLVPQPPLASPPAVAVPRPLKPAFRANLDDTYPSDWVDVALTE